MVRVVCSELPPALAIKMQVAIDTPRRNAPWVGCVFLGRKSFTTNHLAKLAIMTIQS